MKLTHGERFERKSTKMSIVSIQLINLSIFQVVSSNETLYWHLFIGKKKGEPTHLKLNLKIESHEKHLLIDQTFEKWEILSLNPNRMVWFLAQVNFCCCPTTSHTITHLRSGQK